MATDVLKVQYNNLQEENDQYKKLINQQKDYLVSMDREVTVTESRIRENLTVSGGILKQQGKHRHHRKHILILENKLNQDTIKFDKLMCSNMDYRKDIAHLLQQKVLCCSIEDKLNRQLATQQNITKNLGERFTLAHNQRSRAQTRMLEVRKCMEVDAAKFTKSGMLMKTVIAHDTNLQSFMETKLHDIIPLEAEKEQHYQNGGKLQMYMQGYSSLVEVTGERDLCQIVHMFTQNEQKNFAHWSHIDELCNRWEMLKNCTNKMKSDVLFMEEENKRHNEQNKSTLKDLESELEKYSCLSQSLEKQCTVVQRTLEQLSTAISGLLDQIMQKAVIVNSDNIAHFTSILEERITNMLIQANTVEDEQMELAPQNMLLANSDLLPEREVVMETERGKSPSCSLKAA